MRVPCRAFAEELLKRDRTVARIDMLLVPNRRLRFIHGHETRRALRLGQQRAGRHMTEIANTTHGPTGQADPSSPPRRPSQAGRDRAAKAVLPSSDVGTLVLHWIGAVAATVSLVTGLRISADALDAVFSRWMSPILPQGEIWSVHIVSGLTLFGAATGYLVYMALSGLGGRIAIRRITAIRLPSWKTRWLAVNVMLHWLLYGIVLLLTVTGVLLYLGFGGWVVTIHLAGAVSMLAYTLAHILAHFGYGGWRQLLRIFRPTALVPTAGQRSRRPLLIASIVALPAAIAIAGVDYGARDTLVVHKASAGPVLDGVLDDGVWRSATPVRVRTQQGANLGGTGESTVEIRAVHDGSKVHFAFRWQDPSRSLARLPLIKREDGWHVASARAGQADVVDFYEDKFAVIFSRSNALGGGGATHFGPKPLDGKPSSLNQRGLHYTSDGSIIDMWQWKASRGGLLGYVDDQYIGPPREATADEAAQRARYQGGYWNDPGRAFYSYNFGFEGPGGYAGPVKPRRLPVDPAATMKALGPFDEKNPDSVHDEGTMWWMTEATSAPYSEEADRAIPVGSVMPGVIIMGNYEGDRADIRGAARWQDGYWTLEASRSLRTGSRYDLDFEAGVPVYVWVSVFDHSQTRHTRHARPVTLELR